MSLLSDQAGINIITPMPTDRVDDTSVVNDVSSETLTWYYNDSGSWASATGESSGTIVWGRSTYDSILNSSKTAVGGNNDTSVVFAAATRASTRVGVPQEVFEKMQHLGVADQETEIGNYLDDNGDYAIDHRRGQIWLKSKATVADDSIDYSYKTPLTGGGTGDKVDLIKVGGNTVNTDGGNRDTGTQTVTLANDDPAVTSLAILDDWDETDRCAVNLISGEAGVSADSGAIDASTLRVTIGTDDTVATDLTAIKDATEIMDEWDATDDSAVASDGPQIMGAARTSQRSAVANGDAARLTVNEYGELVLAGYDWSNADLETSETNPISDHHSEDVLAEATTQGNGTTYYYFDEDGYRNFSVQIIDTAGVAGTNTYTIETTVQDDGTAQASCDYDPATNEIFGVANVTSSDTLFSDKDLPFKYGRVKVVRTADGGNTDGAWTLHLKKMY